MVDMCISGDVCEMSLVPCVSGWWVEAGGVSCDNLDSMCVK